MHFKKIYDFSISDFYHDIYANSWLQAFDHLSWLITIFPGLFMVWLMIQVRTEDQKLTLIGRIIFISCTVQFCLNLVPVNVDLLRFWLGPLPPLVCTLSVSARFFVTATLLLSFNVINVLRFLYHNVWRNIGYLQDEFFEWLFKVVLVFFATTWTLVWYVVYLMLN